MTTCFVRSSPAALTRSLDRANKATAVTAKRLHSTVNANETIDELPLPCRTIQPKRFRTAPHHHRQSNERSARPLNVEYQKYFT